MGELLVEAGAVAGRGAEGEVARCDLGVVGFLDFGSEESGWLEGQFECDWGWTGDQEGLRKDERTSSRLWRAGRILRAGRVRLASSATGALRAFARVSAASLSRCVNLGGLVCCV